MPTHALSTHAHPQVQNRSSFRIAALLALLISLFGSALVATDADAATPGAAAVQEAAKHKGKPYAYGATGPNRFDCSGFTLYVFSRFGKRLPHNSTDQYRVSQKIAKTSKKPGDLIFTKSSSGRIYHVGVYAGNGKIWHSPKSGDVVRYSSIWTSNYVVGRIN